MDPFENLQGSHRVVSLKVSGRPVTRVLCLVQKDASGQDAYYVLAECEGKAFRWRSMIRDNTVRRLRDEVVGNIVDEREADSLDVELIFFCTAEATKARGGESSTR